MISDTKASVAVLQKLALDFGLNPDDGILVRLGNDIVERSKSDYEILVGNKRLRAIFSFVVSVNKDAPESLKTILASYASRVDYICSSLLDIQQRIQIAVSVLEEHQDLRGADLPFDPHILVDSPEICSVLFRLWKRKLAARRAQYASQLNGLRRRIDNADNWRQACEEGSSRPDPILQDLEDLKVRVSHADNSSLDVQEILSLHQRLDGIVEELDRRSQQQTAKHIRDASKHGWLKVCAVDKSANGQAKELGKIYRCPKRQPFARYLQVLDEKEKSFRSLKPLAEIVAIVTNANG